MFSAAKNPAENAGGGSRWSHLVPAPRAEPGRRSRPFRWAPQGVWAVRERVGTLSCSARADRAVGIDLPAYLRRSGRGSLELPSDPWSADLDDDALPFKWPECRVSTGRVPAVQPEKDLGPRIALASSSGRQLCDKGLPPISCFEAHDS
jgi:hypothetical protein